MSVKRIATGPPGSAQTHDDRDAGQQPALRRDAQAAARRVVVALSLAQVGARERHEDELRDAGRRAGMSKSTLNENVPRPMVVLKTAIAPAGEK